METGINIIWRNKMVELYIKFIGSLIVVFIFCALSIILNATIESRILPCIFIGAGIFSLIMAIKYHCKILEKQNG